MNRSVEDLYALPDDGYARELQAGFLVSEPPAGGRHGDTALALGSALRRHVREHRLGRVLANDTGFVLARRPDTVRAPDVAFVTKERWENYSDPSGFLPGPPDLAVEVLSASNTPGEMHAKVADFLAAGARLVWVVDPEAKTVAVYRTLLAPRFVGLDGVLDGEEVVPGFTLPVAEIFED
ncbi:MAG TPA: Uma2 family endonuclease [Candidatus Polarisedimenticolaceae bacterium]